MTHDQLVKVFPDGRTVHVPTDGTPLKGYELAKADIEKRGDGDDAATISKTSFLASLFKGKGKSKSSDDEEEAAAPAPVEQPKPAPVVVAAAKPAPAAPAPRAKAPAALQLASADVQAVQPPQATQPVPATDETEAKPQTPADIINARGFWDDNATAPKQASPAQMVAAISARRALEAADPQATASVPPAYQALAYAPPSISPVDHANIVAASAPIPRNVRPVRNAGLAATEIDTIATKGLPGKGDPVTTATRLSAGKGSDIWMRIMMLAPSASGAMSVTVMGDTDLTAMRAFFIKPASTITMVFSDDPMLGMSSDHFTGSATAKLEMTSFTIRTALLR
jgi:hypothetical protein